MIKFALFIINKNMHTDISCDTNNDHNTWKGWLSLVVKCTRNNGIYPDTSVYIAICKVFIMGKCMSKSSIECLLMRLNGLESLCQLNRFCFNALVWLESVASAFVGGTLFRLAVSNITYHDCTQKPSRCTLVRLCWSLSSIASGIGRKVFRRSRTDPDLMK